MDYQIEKERRHLVKCVYAVDEGCSANGDCTCASTDGDNNKPKNPPVNNEL